MLLIGGDLLSSKVDILGNVIFPYGVSYIIADYPSLFGTEIGLDMQNWCQQESWALVWSHGYQYSLIKSFLNIFLSSRNNVRTGSIIFR